MNSALMPRSSGSVAHCVESFPKLSETFIHGKVAWLIANGYPVRVVDKWQANRQYDFFSNASQESFRSVSSSLYPHKNRLSNRLIRCGRSAESLATLMINEGTAAINEFIHFCQEGSVDFQSSMNGLLYYNFCRQHRISVAHVHFGFNAIEWIPTKRILGKNLRLIVSMLGKDLTVVPSEQPDIYSKLFQSADLFLVSSYFLRDLALGLGCPKETILVHPVEIDTDFFRPSVATAQRSLKPTILSVGRLVWEKDYATALRTMKCLDQKLTGLDWQYLIVGDGPLKEEMQKEILAAGLAKRVFLLGPKSHTEVRDEMQKADLFFMPSISEGLGASALEAASCGLPVVASRVGGLQEAVIDKRTGFLEYAQDAEGFAHHIAELLTHENLRQAMGFHGRSHAIKRYSAKVLYKRLPEYYWGPRSN